MADWAVSSHPFYLSFFPVYLHADRRPYSKPISLLLDFVFLPYFSIAPIRNRLCFSQGGPFLLVCGRRNSNRDRIVYWLKHPKPELVNSLEIYLRSCEYMCPIPWASIGHISILSNIKILNLARAFIDFYSLFVLKGGNFFYPLCSRLGRLISWLN